MSNRAVSWKLLRELFWTFFKIGPITFGGGYAMIPLIEKESVEVRKWLKREEVVDLLAIAGAAPGAIGLNSAFAIGYRVAGVGGAIAAFLGVTLPTFLIVIGLSITYLMFKDNRKVAAAFEGIRPAIVALIMYAAIRIAKTSIVDKTTMVIGAAAVFVLAFWQVQPILVLLCSPLVGIAAVGLKERIGQKPRAPKRKAKPPEPKNVPHEYHFGDGI